MAGVSDKNARSYSSASTTYSSRPPTRALPPHRATRPPASPVGSRPAAANASVTITVVVVLPCVPATATTVPPATAWLRASARRTTGTPRARARSSSGCSLVTAAVTTSARAPATCSGPCPRHISTPKAAKSAAPEGSVSQPVIVTPCCLARLAKPLIPAPAIPMKWIGRGSAMANRFISEGLIYRIYETCERDHPLPADQCQNPRHDLPGGAWVPPGPGPVGERPQSRAIAEQLGDELSQRVRRQVALGELQRGAGGRERARVVSLVIRRGGRQRHQDARLPPGAQLRRGCDGVVERLRALAAAEHEHGGPVGIEPQRAACGVRIARLGRSHRIAQREHLGVRTGRQPLARLGKPEVYLARAARQPPRGESGKRVLLDERGGDSGTLRPQHDRPRGVAAGPDDDRRPLLVQQPTHVAPHAGREPQPARVAPPGAPIDRLDRQEPMTERLARQQLGLDATPGADEQQLDARLGIAQRLRQREGGDEMAAGAAAGEENLHRELECGVRNAECGVYR